MEHINWNKHFIPTNTGYIVRAGYSSVTLLYKMKDVKFKLKSKGLTLSHSSTKNILGKEQFGTPEEIIKTHVNSSGEIEKTEVKKIELFT